MSLFAFSPLLLFTMLRLQSAYEAPQDLVKMENLFQYIWDGFWDFAFFLRAPVWRQCFLSMDHTLNSKDLNKIFYLTMV